MRWRPLLVRSLSGPRASKVLSKRAWAAPSFQALSRFKICGEEGEGKAEDTGGGRW